ncbi:hypothetical protein KJD96_07795 [Escherichia marmotae]|uniref:Uncharacterized protein n=1 Tax=Escherichia marmotae TaxID=1499973 RepID=A0ABU1BXZ2_9ESCH|nr:hypothetical protein [Escherichia marmotae]MCE5354538.1 hypothetical protein [Escherichia marmotae]MCE5385744.1 hypothetical protein [Escherichia marmotae]MDQ9212752.1 hypothetical protein [Escherichia marmotae]MDQ9227049.1 hypothetical protein [Escherichia marmotae]
MFSQVWAERDHTPTFPAYNSSIRYWK